MSMFDKNLEGLRQKNLLRKICDRGAIPSGKDPSKILISGIEYVNFASNDYLGLAGRIELAEAAKKAIDTYGAGAGASRLLAGGTEIHNELERSIAEFKATEAALLFNSGYTANISAIPALAGEDCTIFSDELNHASIVDGCRLSRAKKIIYRHTDTEHLSGLLEQSKGEKIVITETVFSMDGDIAPIADLLRLCKDHKALLYLDDAHGTGVLGEGRGTLKHFGIEPDSSIIQMGTFSKALGSLGAFIAGDKAVIDWLVNTARGFIFSTALPASVVAASLAAIGLIRSDKRLIERLRTNRACLFDGLKQLGFDTMKSETPIIPLNTGSIENSLSLSQQLSDQGIYAPAIRPPTVPTPRLRLTVTAAHTGSDMEKLLSALKEWQSAKK
ncbi:MAG: 8-amino-7-oxononanoate synthase [Nitrospirae bacterium]|nr:MAG: 8-amino-7-oxononanoate synthase [Nitrospirota bacterium]